MVDPIKIRWTGDAAVKLHTRGVEPRLDGEDSENAERVSDTLTRMKTRVVVEDEAEAEALDDYLTRLIPRTDRGGGRTWMTANHVKAYNRVRVELRREMAARGWGDVDPEPNPEGDGAEDTTTEAEDDAERFVECVREMVRDEGAAVISGPLDDHVVMSEGGVETAGAGVRLNDGSALLPDDRVTVEPFTGNF